MRKWFIVSAVGRDRPGIVADLAQLVAGARRLEWQNRLTIFIRPLEGEPRPPVPAPGTRLFAIETQGMDRAGIVAGICRVLADHHVNIADLHSSSLPSPSGSAIYRMAVKAEVPATLDAARLAKALEERGAELGVEVTLAPA